MIRFVFVLAVVASMPFSALAQDVEARRDAEARALFDAGAAAFDEGRFDEALERFRRAHELSGRAELLYNVAAAADRGGHDDEARAAYEAYLVAVPDAGNRSYVSSRIAVLRARIEHGAAPSAGEVAPPEDGARAVEADVTVSVADGAPAAGPDPTAAIVLFVGAGVAGTAAITTGALGLSMRADLDAACPMRACSDPSLRGRADEMAALGITTDVLAGASLALAAVGLVAALLVPSSPSDAVAIGPGTVRVTF